MKNNSNRLAVKMLISMVAGIIVGLIFMAIRESLGASSAAWQTINNWLFQDITAKGAERAVGLFYIGGQLFVRSLQLVIVPMVFTSIVLAIGTIRDAATLSRVSVKTFFWFLFTSACALLMAGLVGLICYNMGMFNTTIEGVAASAGSTGANPLNVLLNAMPNNLGATFSTNSSILALIVVAVIVGLSLNAKGYDADCTINRACREISDIVVVFLNFVVNKFGPVAVFMLLCRTFATYGTEYLKPSRRAARAKAAGAQLLLSIHLNYDADSRVSGFECCPATPQLSTNADSLRFARLVAEKFSAMGMELRGIDGVRYIYFDGNDNRYIRESNDTTVLSDPTFTVVKKCGCPAVLVEEGFITNAGDVALVATDAACEAAAQAYYECILTYFDLT